MSFHPSLSFRLVIAYLGSCIMEHTDIIPIISLCLALYFLTFISYISKHVYCNSLYIFLLLRLRFGVLDERFPMALLLQFSVGIERLADLLFQDAQWQMQNQLYMYCGGVAGAQTTGSFGFSTLVVVFERAGASQLLASCYSAEKCCKMRLRRDLEPTGLVPSDPLLTGSQAKKTTNIVRSILLNFVLPCSRHREVHAWQLANLNALHCVRLLFVFFLGEE